MARALRNQKFTLTAEAVIADYRLAYSSRRASVIGRAEVLRGNATFGIFGDGKEVANIAMAKAFRPGDWRAGYYRDQTFMWATRMSNVRAFFAQLYGTGDVDADPASGGRQMGNHFATRFLDDHGAFERSVDMPNSSADVSNAFTSRAPDTPRSKLPQNSSIPLPIEEMTPRPTTATRRMAITPAAEPSGDASA